MCKLRIDYLLTAETRVESLVSLCWICVGCSGTETGCSSILRLTPVIIIFVMFYTCLHPIRRRSGRSLGIFKQSSVVSDIKGHCTGKYCHVLFLVVKDFNSWNCYECLRRCRPKLNHVRVILHTWGDENVYKIVVWKLKGNVWLSRPKNVKIDLKEIGCVGVDRFQLAQGWVVNTIGWDVGFHKREGMFDLPINSFSIKAPFHGITFRI